MSDSISLPSYTDYPLDLPFLNSNLRRSPAKPVIAYPESSGAGMGNWGISQHTDFYTVSR